MNAYVNHVRGGRVAAICECCGRRSKSTKPNHKGEPELWEIGFGWSQAPYPADFKHDDGSVGSTYHCPSCCARSASSRTPPAVRWSRCRFSSWSGDA